jgi:lysophospholipase L1-like esterase
LNIHSWLLKAYSSRLKRAPVHSRYSYVENGAPAAGAIAYNAVASQSDLFRSFKRLGPQNESSGDTSMNCRNALSILVLTGLMTATAGVSQEPGTKPETNAPAAAPVPAAAPKLTASGHPDNEFWRQHDRLMLFDFPWLAHFKEADAQLGPPAVGENRVVFLGDSITQGWQLDQSFPGKPYVNRGISGQTTPQMVLRFHQDVVNLKPKAVVILGGINDIAGNTGPMSLEDTENNLTAMAEIATANGIKIVFCSVLPAYDFPWSPGQYPAQKIVTLNDWIKSYAASKGITYVDYYSAMKDDRGGLPSNLSRDGVHPNAAGHAIMEPLVTAGIQKALAK